MTELRSVLDTAVLDQLRVSVGDDPEFLAELVDDFLQDASVQLESLRVAVASDAATDARRAAHTLKGNSRTFGAMQLATLCQEAETAAANGDLSAVLPHLDEIDGEFRCVSVELLAWRDDRG